MPLEPTAKRARPPGNKCWCGHGGKEHLNTAGGHLSQDDRGPCENRTTVGSSHHTSRCMSKGNEFCNPQTYLSVHVYWEATHHNRGCNHLRPSPTRTRRNEGYIDSRILLSCKDEWGPVICSRMNRTGENCTKWSQVSRGRRWVWPFLPLMWKSGRVIWETWTVQAGERQGGQICPDRCTLDMCIQALKYHSKSHYLAQLIHVNKDKRTTIKKSAS